MRKHQPAVALTLLLCSAATMAQEIAPDSTQQPSAADDNFAQLEAESRDIKAQMLELEAELSTLEQEIRYPAPTRWTVFVTSDDADDMPLRQIELEVAGRLVASHEYSEREQAALRDGGAHRLYIGNLNTGNYPVTVRFSGQAGEQPTAGNTEFELNNAAGPQLLELHWQPGADGGAPLRHDSYADTP